MQITTHSEQEMRVYILLVINTENSTPKLNKEQIIKLKEFKESLGEENFLSKSTHVLSEYAGIACEVTDLLLSGYEHSEMHEETFPSCNDLEIPISELTTTIKNTLENKPEQIFIVCGTENCFKLMNNFFTNKN